MENEKNRAPKVFLIVIRLSNENSNRAHLMEVGPLIKGAIEKLSNKECQLAYTDKDGYGFAWLAKTSLYAQSVKNLLINSDNNGKGCAIRHGDSILVLEVGEECAGTGFSNAWSWLQHHYS